MNVKDEQPIEFELDGYTVEAKAGETVWQVANRLGNTIPHLCLSTEPDFRPDGNCRLCMVEVEGWHPLAASCITHPNPGMVVRTKTERTQTVRRTVMELLLVEADIPAGTEADAWATALNVRRGRFPSHDDKPSADNSHPGIIVELSACIACLRCLQACREVEIYDVIGMANRGARSKIVFDFDDPMAESTCVSCGSCAQTCPTGAIDFRGAG